MSARPAAQRADRRPSRTLSKASNSRVFIRFRVVYCYGITHNMYSDVRLSSCAAFCVGFFISFSAFLFNGSKKKIDPRPWTNKQLVSSISNNTTTTNACI
jgi:hypothetical protein